MTLLGSFYSRILGSVEYLASESLLFILNKSGVARNTFSNFIRSHTNVEYIKGKGKMSVYLLKPN